MPFVRIDHSVADPDFGRQASICVQKSLIDVFGVPEQDYFQVIHKRQHADDLFGPGEFLGISHTNQMAFVQITCAEGRSTEAKQALYRSIATALGELSDVRPADVIINLVETRRENWSFGNGEAPFA